LSNGSQDQQKVRFNFCLDPALLDDQVATLDISAAALHLVRHLILPGGFTFATRHPQALLLPMLRNVATMMPLLEISSSLP